MDTNTIRHLAATALTALSLLASDFGRVALAQTIERASQSLDESGLIKIEVQAGQYNSNSKYVEVFASREVRGSGRRTTIPHNLVRGIQIYVNGQLHEGNPAVHTSLRYKPSMEPSHDSTGRIPLRDSQAELEIKFYGHTIGKYTISQAGLRQTLTPKLLSQFDIRRFSQEEEGDVSYLNGRPIPWTRASGPEANDDIRRWMAEPIFVDTAPTHLTSQVDLHTHFAGAVSANDLIEIAEKLEIPYPVKQIERMGLEYNEGAVIEIHGEKFIPFSRKNISFSTFRDGHDYSLFDYFEVGPHITVPHAHLSLIYKMRDPIVKNLDAFPLLLERLAKDYAKNGVKYAELSFYPIVKPERLTMVNQLVPELERKYGVRLRFLVGLWRHGDAKANADSIRETKEAMKASPYIVGVDFMGNETNPTHDFKPALEELAALKAEFLKMVLRVHAGENPNHPNNILEAITLGATRIGHGIYGVTDEVIRLAKEKDVIIEFNFNSNLALQNVHSTKQLATVVKKYLDGGVRATFGTDGHGLYHTSPMSEYAVARSLGLKDIDFQAIRHSDDEYVRSVETEVKARLAAKKAKVVKMEYNRLNRSSGGVSIRSCRDIFIAH